MTLIAQQPILEAKESHKNRDESCSSSKKKTCKKVKKILRKINRTTKQDLEVDINTNAVVQDINQTVNQIDQTVNNIDQTTETILGILETPCVTFITSVPYVINTPGYYKLSCDLFFNPTADGTNAITINPSVKDVNLDFANHTLSMSASSTTADNHGVLINEGSKNILIHDGTIQGFSASQIRGYTNLNTIEISNMVLAGISDSTGSRMVNETYTSGVNIGPVEEAISFVVDPAIDFSNNIKLTNLIIRDIFLENLTIADQSAWGVALFYCNNIQMDHVYVDRITNNGLIENAVVHTLAFGLNVCRNCVSTFCHGNDILSLSPDFGGSVVGDAYGVNYIVCDRTENYDCSYSNNVGTRRGGGVVWVSSNNFVAERCVSDGNRLINPLAVGVQSHYGFEAVRISTDPEKGIIKNCQVLNQPTAFVAIGARDIVFEDCIAIAGNLVADPALFAEGFQANAGSNGITFKNCIATGFIVPAPNTAFNSAGFRMNSGATNINIIDCKSTKNSIGIFVNAGVTRVVVDGNEVAFNTQFGIRDLTPVQTPNLYIRNVAYANPVNYSVNTTNANFAVVQASQSAGFPLYTAPNASPLSNFDLQP